MRTALRTGVSAAVVLAAVIGPGGSAAQAPAATQSESLLILSPEGRRELAVYTLNGRDLVALNDLAGLFQLALREDAATRILTATYKGRTIVLTPGRDLASVDGRLVSLPSAPRRDGPRWLVPVEFISRALARVYDRRIELRADSGLVIVGDLRVPRVSVQVEDSGGEIRLTFDVAPAAKYAIGQDRDRLHITFDADALDAALPAVPPQALVRSIGLGESPTTVTIALGPTFASFRASEIPGPRGSARLAVDILPETAVAPPPARPQQPAPAPGLGASAPLAAIVIDPGHGGDDTGTRGSGGTLEKQITLGVARRLRSAIEGRLGVRVLLTRDADQAVNLDARAALANNNKADLFVSLHAGASLRPSLAGARVWFLSPEEYRGGAQGQPAPPPALPVFGGGTRVIEPIPWETAQLGHIERSATLARIMADRLRERLGASPRAVQQAPLRVLVGANMPAVLVELGALSNAEEERRLASDGHQASLAQALLEGIIRFRDHLQDAQRSGMGAADRVPMLSR